MVLQGPGVGEVQVTRAPVLRVDGRPDTAGSLTDRSRDLGPRDVAMSDSVLLFDDFSFPMG